MDIIEKNDIITNEILHNNVIDIQDVLDNIRGSITTEKIYKEIFSRLNIDMYISDDGKYYINLKEYIEKISSSKCTDKQILKNKFAVDKSKIKKINEISIRKYYGKYDPKNKKTKLIEINGIQTVNNSIERYSKELDSSFYDWQKLCEAMIIHIPKYLESACKKYFKKQMIKFQEMNDNLQEQIDLLKKENSKKDRKINKLEQEVLGSSSRIDRQQEQIDMLSERFDKMKRLVE